MIFILPTLIKYGTNYYTHNKWNRQRILKYSEKNFRKILKYAYKHSSFYKNYYLWRGIKYADLEHIPIKDIPTLSKDTVRKNFYNICTKSVNPQEIKQALKSNDLLPKVKNKYIVHTSGSTGIPSCFLYDYKALTMLESNFIRLSLGGEKSIGLKDFPIKSLYIAPVGSGYACTALAMFGMERFHCNSIVINAQTPITEWKKQINDYKPCYLSGYPSCITLVASLVEKGELDIHPKKIITGGEPLTKENIIYYKKIFDADIIDFYGCTESICIGAGTSYYNGMYLFDDLNYIEHDENNKLIITPLYNKLFPLIRYRLNDIVDNIDKKGFRNLPYTHINKILGRNEDLMWFINEFNKKDFLHPLFLDDLNVKGILKYQFIKKSNLSFEIKCVSIDKNKDIQKQHIRKQIDIFLKNKKMNNIHYSIKFVDDILPDKTTGKIKLVIN